MRKILGAALLLACAPSFAQVRSVWQIGTFNRSSGEFHDSFGVNYASKQSDVDYTIGKNKAADWLRFQPGPANGLTGGRTHPFRIHFNLEGYPKGNYTLKIAVLYETPRLSTLALDINGHTGNITFDPQLDWGAGDWEGTFVPQTSHAERSISIPAHWLHTGENLITLTAKDDPAVPENSLGDIAPGESGLVYDAIALLQDPEAAKAAGETNTTGPPEASAKATVFFQQAGNILHELVQACAYQNPNATGIDKLTLELPGFTQSQQLRAANEFGDRCVRFSVPEWNGDRAGRLLVNGAATSITLHAQKKWTIFVVPHEHLDIGFTDYREKVAELQSESIDGVLDLLPDHPEFRWTIDGSWIAQQYLAGRSKERGEQFLAAVRAGKIVLPPQFANQHTGTASLEGLAESFRYSHSLAAKEGLPVGAANITDVPSYSWSYASILHDAGVRYFAAASNNWRAPILLQGHWNEKSPFYWEGPDGGRVLMWYSRAYLQLASMFGVPPKVEAVRDALPVFLQAYSRPDYYSSSVILFGTQLENTVLDRGQVSLPQEWQKLYAYPRLQFSTFKDSLASIEHDFGDRIPTYRGDFGPYWEDGFTSDARATAMHRNNQQRLLNAEVMATLPSLLDTKLRPDAGLLRNAWQDSLLFDEHTWGSVADTTQPEGDQSVRQIEEKRQQAKRAETNIEYSIERSFAQLSSQLHPQQDSILVFNALPWARSGWLETDLPEGKRLSDPTGKQDVQQEIVRVEAGTTLPGFGGRTVRLRYRTDGVPGVGYKLLSIVDGAPASGQANADAARMNVLENRFYRITLDPASGSIHSIWDKELQRELVDQGSPYPFASYVYVTGADDMPHNSLYRYGTALPAPELEPHVAAQGRIVRTERSAGMQVATLASTDAMTPVITTTIALPDDAKRIDITVSLTKDSTYRREAAYIAFPFAVQNPSFAYDIQNGWVDPSKDELAGGSREWYATQHWAAVHNRQVAAGVVCTDAPLVNFGDIVRGTWPENFSPRTSTIFSWLMSNYWSTNFFAAQSGHFAFHYAIVSGSSFEPAALSRLGIEQMTPLESDHVVGQPDGRSPDSDIFLHVQAKNVQLTAWHRAADDSGSVLRLVELAGQPASVDVSAKEFRIENAQECSLLEDCTKNLPVSDGHVRFTMTPHQILTLKLKTAPVNP
jgi:hypothetical protein